MKNKFGLPENTIFFDIESGGLEANYSSILSISYSQGNNNQSFYANPTPGSFLSKWSEKNVWETVRTRSPTSEENALKGFLGVLEANKGGTVAGWNIGVEPMGQISGWKGQDFRGPRGYDIPMLISRAEKYGLSERYREAFGNVNIRDIGREYAYKIAKAVYPHRQLIDEQLWRSAEQLVKLGQPLEAQGMSEQQIAVELAKGRYQLAGWKQENIYSLLFDKGYQAHESAEDIQALREIVEKGDSSVLHSAELAQKWNKVTLKNTIISKVFKGARPFEKAEEIYPSLMQRAAAFGIQEEVEQNILKEAAVRGADLSRLKQGLGFVEEFSKIDGGKIASGGLAKDILTKGAKFAWQAAKEHPGITTLGLGLGLAYLTKPLSIISGKDDQYNTIEGLQHRGIAGQTRRVNTDFGSGYQGIKDFFVSGIERFNRLSTTKKSLLIGGIAGAGFVTHALLSNRAIQQDSTYDKNYRPEWKALNIPGLAIEETDNPYQIAVKRQFGEFAQLLQKFGQTTGTGHKRIMIPKTKLTQEDLEQVLGFEPVTVAIPEAGQTALTSYRHPYALFHLHEHGKFWTMHKDEHAAATMLNKRWEISNDPDKSILTPVENLISGLPHLLTEGLPGAGYYLEGQISNAADMLERLKQETSAQYFNIVGKMRDLEHPTWLGKRYKEFMRSARLKVNHAFNRISGKDDTYNTIEGLRHGGLAEQKRKQNTDFGSGWDALRGLVRAGETFEGMLASKEFQRALRGAQKVQEIGKGFFSEAYEMSGSFRNAPFSFIRKMHLPGQATDTAGFINEIEKLRELSSQNYRYSPSLYGVRDTSFGTELDIELFRGQTFKELKQSNPQLIEQYKNQAIQNIQQLHTLGIRHADTHSGNIMLVNTPRGKEVGILDYGLSQYFSELAPEVRETYQANDLNIFIRSLINDRRTILSTNAALDAAFKNKISGRDDTYNTIEGLRHGGIAEVLRKQLTDFGSGWTWLVRKALSKGISAERVASISTRLGRKLEIQTSKEGATWLIGKKLGKGGFGVVSEAFEAGTGRAGVYKHIGTTQKIEEGTGILSPAFSHKILDTNMNTEKLTSADMFQRQYFIPSSDLLRKSTNEYGGMGATHEAAMQRIARSRMGDIVPEVYGTTETGIFMESAGAPIKAGEEIDALKWLQEKWIKELSHIPSPGETIVHHLDPQIKNIMRKGKQYKLIDWGVAATTKESLPREMVNAAEDAYQEYIERAIQHFQGPQIDKQAMSAYHRKAVATMTKSAQAPGRGHTKPVGTLII